MNLIREKVQEAGKKAMKRNSNILNLLINVNNVIYELLTIYSVKTKLQVARREFIQNVHQFQLLSINSQLLKQII